MREYDWFNSCQLMFLKITWRSVLILFLSFPFRAKQFMTKKSAVIIEGFLCVLFATFNIHVFFIVGTMETAQNISICTHLNNSWSLLVPWFDLFLYAVSPSVLIISFNIIILVKLCRRKNIGTNTTVQRSIYKIVPMTMLVSTVFVISTMPICLFYIGK